jgi:hypothetical protein
MPGMVLSVVRIAALAAQSTAESPAVKSARTMSSLVELLILAIFLILLFIFMVSLLVAVRRIMLARRGGPREKTKHIDAWTIAGQRLKTDEDPEEPDDPSDKN